MIRKFCDICDKEIKNPFGNELTFHMVPDWKESKYELCPSCTEKIEKFIKELKKNG